MKAAKFLGVAPWDLARQPSWWRNIAIEFANAEAWADEERRKQGKKKGKRRA